MGGKMNSVSENVVTFWLEQLMRGEIIHLLRGLLFLALSSELPNLKTVSEVACINIIL